MSLAVGDLVPEFTVLRWSKDPISGSELWKDRGALILFFPLAFSGDMEHGCTKEMCSFRDRFADFRDADVDVYGISHDSPFAQKAWVDHLGLPFPLVSDWEWQAAKAFDVLDEELFGFRPLNQRVSFIVGTDGRVEHVDDPGSSAILPDPDSLLAAARRVLAG